MVATSVALLNLLRRAEGGILFFLSRDCAMTGFYNDAAKPGKCALAGVTPRAIGPAMGSSTIRYDPPCKGQRLDNPLGSLAGPLNTNQSNLSIGSFDIYNWIYP